MKKPCKHQFGLDFVCKKCKIAVADIASKQCTLVTGYDPARYPDRSFVVIGKITGGTINVLEIREADENPTRKPD